MGNHRIEFEYAGELAELIVAFILHKRALGFKYSTEASLLRVFAEFSTRYDVSECKLPKDLVSDWSERRLNEKAGTNENRISVLRQFALYLEERGYRVSIPAVPPRGIDHFSFTPYIFSHGDVSAIFETSDRLKIRKYPPSNMQQVFPVIIRMLYGCGLRISEAINLRVADVDLDQGLLTIKDSKFGKDRLVPMSDSLTLICRDYFRQAHPCSRREDYFFAHRDGSPMSRSSIYKRFRDVLWKSGISHGGRGKGPRLHDLRHSFAVHSLKMQADKGIDPYCSLPILSAYLGHDSVGATEKYVRLTEEMYPELVKRVSAACVRVIPEVRI